MFQPLYNLLLTAFQVCPKFVRFIDPGLLIANFIVCNALAEILSSNLETIKRHPDTLFFLSHIIMFVAIHISHKVQIFFMLIVIFYFGLLPANGSDPIDGI